MERCGARLTPDSGWRGIQKRLRRDKLLYLMILPALIWYIMFCYVPMGGMVLAFKTYRYDMGIFQSPWCAIPGHPPKGGRFICSAVF